MTQLRISYSPLHNLNLTIYSDEDDDFGNHFGILHNAALPINSVSLGTDLPLANHNPAISSVPPVTENLNKSPLAQKKPQKQTK